LSGFVLLTLPSLAFGAVHQWTVWGTPNYFARPDYQAGPVFLGTVRALHDYFWGASHRSFWGNFGWLDAPLVVGPEPVNEAVKVAIRLLTALFLVLTLCRLAQVGHRLVRVARRGHWRRAVRAAFANPVLNSYFLFTVFMIYLHVRLSNGFG